MKRLDADIGSLQTAFQETPEVFHPVGMDLPVRVSFSVVDDFVSVFIQAIVRFQFIAVDGRSGFHMLTDVGLDSGLAPIRNDGGAYLTVTLQNGGHDGFTKVVTLAHFVPLACPASAGNGESVRPLR